MTMKLAPIDVARGRVDEAREWYQKIAGQYQAADAELLRLRVLEFAEKHPEIVAFRWHLYFDCDNGVHFECVNTHAVVQIGDRRIDTGRDWQLVNELPALNDLEDELGDYNGDPDTLRFMAAADEYAEDIELAIADLRDKRW
jgi:hypothetical protein